jgi:hypothetical protein
MSFPLHWNLEGSRDKSDCYLSKYYLEGTTKAETGKEITVT